MNTQEILVSISFEISEDADRNAQQLARLIEQKLAQLESVKEVQAIPEENKLTGIEVLAAIAVTVLIIRAGREGVHELRLLVEEIKKLIESIQGVKGANISVGEIEVPVEDVKENDMEELLHEAML